MDPRTITALSVKGFKSIADKREFEIRPLTILAGANSSGKSSALQPFLILKQTLEAPHDPGPLLINGPNVKFTSHTQFMSSLGDSSSPLELGISLADGSRLEIHYSVRARGVIKISEMRIFQQELTSVLREGLSEEELGSQVSASAKQFYEAFPKELRENSNWEVIRDRCFLAVQLRHKDGFFFRGPFPLFGQIEALRGIIHVRGLRGNPERNYPLTAVGNTYPGPFEDYVASILQRWQDRSDGRMERLSQAMESLGLTSKVSTRNIDEVQVELRVARLTRKTKGKTPTVSLADVGLGVSQVLPVLVALIVAEPGQLVYIEQPEIHLHPAAQIKLANLMLDASGRGVTVVAETHSALLLLAIQTIAAESRGNHNLVKLHWFSRDKTGSTQVTSADLDESGAFGAWPTDFIDVALKLEDRFIKASSNALAQSRRANRK